MQRLQLAVWRLERRATYLKGVSPRESGSGVRKNTIQTEFDDSFKVTQIASDQLEAVMDRNWRESKRFVARTRPQGCVA
jgi:hypothetical protein